MTTTTRICAALLLPAVVGVVVGCATVDPTPAPAPPPSDADRALAAYEEFWTRASEALAAPAARDWDPVLEGVATGQALDALRADVENYALVPAHTEGVVSRAPVVGSVAPDRVTVVDCVDLGDSRLVADRTGEVLDDLANRVQRYRYRAELVPRGAGWVVERTAPALDEPC